MIASFADMKGKLRQRKERVRKDRDPLLDDLHKWSEDVEEAATSMDEAKSRFAEIKKSVIEGCDKRWHWWYLPSIIITSAQSVMFGLAIFPLLQDL